MSDSSGPGVDTLADTVTETHDVLTTRLADAEACRPTRVLPRDRMRATDPFLASTSRHVAAVNAVLGPAARRHLPDGRRRAHDLARQSRRLEGALFQTKSKLYGSTFVVRRPWASIWHEVGEMPSGPSSAASSTTSRPAPPPPTATPSRSACSGRSATCRRVLTPTSPTAG